MSQDKTIKGVMERFREKYTPEWWLGFCSDYSSNSRGIDSIEQFIQQEIKLALESVVPEEKYQDFEGLERMDYWADKEESSKDTGYNQAINEIKENIKHYLE